MFGYVMVNMLRYNSLNYSIPTWAKKEYLNEMFNLTHVINIIEWKMKNKFRSRELTKATVPRGETVRKKLDVSENKCPWCTADTL